VNGDDWEENFLAQLSQLKKMKMHDHELNKEPVSTLHSLSKAMRWQTFPRKYGGACKMVQ